MKRQYFNGNCFKYFFKNPKFKTIVFIHGLGLNQDVWSWQVSLFKNHNVLIYDLLGHGDSKDPEGEISLSLFLTGNCFFFVTGNSIYLLFKVLF